MNEELKNNLKLNIAISKIKKEEEHNMFRYKRKMSKCIISLICTLVATTGIVFAANFENIQEFFSNSRGLGNRN